MPRWDVEPAGVRGVLGRTEHVASGFEGHLRGLESALEGAGRQSSSGIVARALGGWAQAESAAMRFCFTRAGEAMSGAANATRAYVAGDEEMAANAASSASAAPVPANMPGTGGGGPH